MMIPPVLGPSKPGGEVDTPGEGFAEAMAAAIGATPMATIPVTVEPSPAPTPQAGVGEIQETESQAVVAVPAPIPIAGLSEQVARLAQPLRNPIATAAEVAAPAATNIAPNLPAGTKVAPVATYDEGMTPAGPQDVAHPAVSDRVEEGFDRTGEATALSPEAPVSRSAVESAGPNQGDVPTGTAIAESAVSGEVRVAPSATVNGAGTPDPSALVETDGRGTPRPAADQPLDLVRSRPLDSAQADPAAATPAPTPGQPVTSAASPTDESTYAVEGPAPRSEPTTDTTEQRPDAPIVTGAGPTPIDAPDRDSSSGLVPASTLRRVEDAIRRLENAPPPRAITIAVDEHGLQRVTVSLHTDGVRLSIPAGASTDAALMADLERSLENHGFDLSGREHRSKQEQRDEADRFVPTAPRRTRTEPTDPVRI